MKRSSLFFPLFVGFFALLALPFFATGCESCSKPSGDEAAKVEPVAKAYPVTEAEKEAPSIKNPPKAADADFGGYDPNTSLEILKIEQNVLPIDEALVADLKKQGKEVVYQVNVVVHAYIDPKIKNDAIRVALFNAHDLAVAKVKGPTREVRQVTVRAYAKTKGWQNDLAGGYAMLVIPDRTTKPEFTLVEETLRELRGQKETVFGLTEEERKTLAKKLFQAKLEAGNQTRDKDSQTYNEARDLAFQKVLGEDMPLRAAFMILEEAQKKGWPQK